MGPSPGAGEIISNLLQKVHLSRLMTPNEPDQDAKQTANDTVDEIEQILRCRLSVAQSLTEFVEKANPLFFILQKSLCHQQVCMKPVLSLSSKKSTELLRSHFTGCPAETLYLGLGNQVLVASRKSNL